MKVNQSVPGVYHCEFDSQYEVVAAFMRLQEFYECPSDKIRGRFFSFEDFIEDYASRHGNFTYFTDWGGFNVPGYVVVRFYEIFRRDLTDREQELLSAVDAGNRAGDFYVIGTYDSKYIDHEMAHAFWYLHETYRERMLKLIGNCGIEKSMTTALLKMGYNIDQVADEIQAYLATSEVEYLEESFKIRTKWKCVPHFHTAFRQWLKFCNHCS